MTDASQRGEVVVLPREAITHDLKTWPVAFAAVSEGLKPWEYRKADRDYRVGDFLLLREWSEARGYTGETLVRNIVWMLPGGMFGIPADHCILSLAAAPPAPSGDSGAWEALGGLLRHVDDSTCVHEDTHRGGAIWTICNGCGRKWADDEGGFVSYADPPAVAQARQALALRDAGGGSLPPAAPSSVPSGDVDGGAGHD